MKMRSTYAGVAAIAVYFVASAAGPTASGATSLAARDASPGKSSSASPKAAPQSKDDIVAKYVKSCLAQPAKEEECGLIRSGCRRNRERRLTHPWFIGESHVHAHHIENLQQRRCGVADRRGGRYRYDRPSG